LNTLRQILFCLFVWLAWSLSTSTAYSDQPPPDVLEFLESNCYDCHQGSGAEAGFDLEKFPKEFGKSDVQKWVRIFDRVRDHEMPPKDSADIDATDRDQFLKSTGSWLKTEQLRVFKTQGRVRGRRLTNLQLERTLHDLVGIDIPLAARMPEEPRVNGFTTVADGQPMSHFQLEQHIDVVDAALEESFRRATSSRDDEWSRTRSDDCCSVNCKSIKIPNRSSISFRSSRNKTPPI
jgi:hypothetical protein